MEQGHSVMYDCFVIPNEEVVPTTLYNLSPVNYTGKDVESLSSYILRLANLHCLKVRDLFTSLIFPDFIEPKKEYFSPQINGHGILATNTIKILEKLTGRGDLKKLTLTNYREVLSRVKLFKTHKSWCPVCLNEMQKKSEIIYEKNIWNINGYSICVKHFTNLENTCEKCGKFQRILPNKGMNGYCQNCHNWLGKDISINQQIITKSNEENIYKSKQIEEMLTYFSKESTVEYAKLINSLITINKILPKTSLLRELDSEISYPSFLEYTSQKNIPTIENLLIISWKLKINLVDLLINKGVKSVLQEKNPMRRMEHQIEEAIESPKYMTLYSLAKELNTYPETLRKNFPELIKVFNQKNRMYKKTKDSVYNHNRDKVKVENYLNEQLKSTEVISINEIAEHLNISRSTLEKRFPILIEELKEKHKSFRIKRDLLENNINILDSKELDFNIVKGKLLDILQSIENKNKPIYMKKVKQIVGIPYERLRRDYRDITDHIIKKNKEVEKKLQRSYYLDCEEKLVATINNLFLNGIYPGVATLQKQLDFRVKNPKLLGIRNNILIEFGIEKKPYFKT
jgi:biotin operon repressor